MNAVFTFKECKMKKRSIVLLVALLSAVFFSACSKQEYNAESDFEFQLNNEGDLFITNYVGEKKEVRIPPKIQKKPVIGIGMEFGNRTGNTKYRM